MENAAPVEHFVPMDRRQALVRGEALPVRSQGAVLFADVSGFTPLTAVLNERLGPQRGAEELTKQLNRVFEVLITAVHEYGGSVITFSGDAITCWFEGDNGRRATTCAFEMQREMERFVNVSTQDGLAFSLALKVAVVAGKANRYLVGHTHIQRLEALAGATLDRVAAAEQLLNKGEIIVGAEVIGWFGNQIRLVHWRADERGEYFAVVKSSRSVVPPLAWPAVTLKPEIGREWLLPPVAERVLRGEGDYLAQLRSCVALFLRFGGIDYDQDKEAGAKLDAYIRWVQTVLAKYEGFLLELTIGDKGSYLYAVFGTPLTHEDDPARSVSAALDLQSPPDGLAFTGPVQIGISQGVMRAGAYGGSQRRSYGVQGQEVNIAARLMSHAEPGQILVSSRILKAAVGLFEFDSLGPISLKGLHDPITVYHAVAAKSRHFLQERIQSDTGPLVGRKDERAVLDAQLEKLVAGHGRTVVIEGEAGIGKSRLVADFLERAMRKGVDLLVGAGNEVTHSVAYHGWRSVFQQLFGLEQEGDIEQAWERVTEWLGMDAAGQMLQRAPLLNVVLPFHIPDSALTSQMSGDLRANNTNDLLVSILKKAAEKRPLLLVLEEAHWLDSTSWTLIERLNWEEMPLLLMVVSRPAIGVENAAHFERLRSMPNTLAISLTPFSIDETIQLVCQRLDVSTLPVQVGELIQARTEGHPFFSEELAIALRDTNILKIEDGTCYLTTNLDALSSVGFPNNIQMAITSRIDRLTPAQQLSLKVSSVLGRAFLYRPLHDIYPLAADRADLDAHLRRLEQLAIIQPEGSGPERLDKTGGRGYRFKDAITHDVAYNLLLFEQRRELHRAVGDWYERAYKADLSGHYAFLAYHWQKSNLPERAINYLALAGEQALKNGAFQEAVTFFESLIELFGKFGDRWEPIDTNLSKGTHLAIWHRQLGEGYAGLSDTAQIIEHGRKALALLGKPVPNRQAHLVLRFIRETAVQVSHRLFPARFLGKRQAEVIEMERGRAALLLQEAYFFADQFLSSFQTAMFALNSLDVAGMGSYERVRTLSNFIVGMIALPRNFFLSGYERLARLAVADSKSVEARAFFEFRMGFYYFGVGRWAEGEEAHLRVLDLYRELGHWRLMVECMTSLGTYSNYRGKFDNIRELGEEVYQLAERQGSLTQMIWGLNLMAIERLRTAEGGQEALDYLESSAKLMDERLLGQTRELFLGWLAEVYLKMGQFEMAKEAADEISILLGKTPPLSSLKLGAMTARAQTYLAIWERDGERVDSAIVKKARSGCRSLARFTFIFPIGRPRSALYWGWYHWLSGRKLVARYYWRRALSEAKALEMAYDEGLAHFELGRHLTAEEERNYHLRQAEMIFERLGASYDLKRCRKITGN